LSDLPQHILVIRLSAMGDVAMTVPVLRVLCETYPELKVTVLTRKLFAPFFDDIPNLKVHVAQVNGAHKGPFGLYRLSNEIKALGIDAIADLHDVLRSQVIRKLLSWRSIPFQKIDKGRSEKAALVRKENKVYKQLKTSHQRYADVFAELGYPIDLERYTSPEVPDISNKTKQLIDLLCPSNRAYNNWIGIAPFAKHEGKTYPIDLIEEVIEELVKGDQLIFLFGGGEEETKIMQQIDNQYANVINMAGKVKLTEEMRLINKLVIMISMDSANMHIASLVGTRVLSLWGATHPYAGFYGWGQSLEDALYPNPNEYPLLPCSIYGNKVFEGYEDCMRSIEPEDIVHKVHSVMQNV